MPTFADMQASLRRNNSNGRSFKGASSFYGDNPFMDNIPEHPDEHARSRSTSASSGHYEEYRPEIAGVISPFDGQPKGLDGILAASNPTTPKDEGLIRQASFGKRQRALLTNVRQSDHKSIAPSFRYEDPDEPLPAHPDDHTRSAVPSSNALGLDMVPAPLSPRTANSGAKSPSLDDKSTLISDRSVKTPSPKIGPSWPLKSPLPPSDSRGGGRPPLSPPHSRFSREVYPQPPNQNAGGKLFLMPERKKSLKDRVGEKAPQSINMNAVREAEARGSMTSLPGLLNRALQMASNLENGKTSSKQSDWFGNDLLKNLGERGKSTGSINMLNNNKFGPSFNQPPSRGSNMSEKWPRAAPLPPSGLRQVSANHHGHHDERPQKRSRSRYDHRHPRPSRKCCGLPLWLFFLLLIITLVLIILAVVLPIVLVVIPNEKKAADPTCASKHPCANGGASVPDTSGNCFCICSGTFSGTNCTVGNTAGSCGSIAAATLPNAAIGSNLPPLIENAQRQYQVPLNATSILTAFSSNDVNCDIQNTLVAITTGTSTRRRRSPDAPATTHPPSPHIHSHVPRQDQAITQGGLVIAGPDSATTSAAAAPTSTTKPTTQYTDNNHIDFAKTAILYTLQISQRLDFAVQASQKLQPFFNGVGAGQGGQSDPKSVDMGNGWSLDLVDLKVTGMGTSAGSGTGKGSRTRGNP